MNKLKAIITGWNLFLKDDAEASKLAEERSKVCSRCPEAVKDGVLSMITKVDKIKEIATYKCKQCQCPLSTKLRVKDEKCPLKKW